MISTSEPNPPQSGPLSDKQALGCLVIFGTVLFIFAMAFVIPLLISLWRWSLS